MPSIKLMRSLKSSSKYYSGRALPILAIASSLTLGLVIGPADSGIQESNAATTPKATTLLAKIATKGRAPKTGYDRELFSDGWGDLAGCDLRNYILRRDLTSITWRSSPACTVATGILKDPYTSKTIYFTRGVSTSLAVQIDHVVAVSDAWQKGAQQLSYANRYAFYNDPLNLLAVDGPTNGQKSDSDAASWLPPNKAFRCSYVARQIAVKYKYKLWVTTAERATMAAVLKTCPGKLVPKA